MAKWMDPAPHLQPQRQAAASCSSASCIALGTTVCRAGNVGVDLFTAMNRGSARAWHTDFGTFQLLVNLAILAAVVFALDKYQIGLGTLIINMVGAATSSSCSRLLGFPPKFEGLVSAGVHLGRRHAAVHAGVSLYLKTRMGVSSHRRYIAPIAAERLPFSYTACRMTQDIP